MTSRPSTARLHDDVARVALGVEQQVVDRGHVVRLDAEPGRQRALRVEVDREHLASVAGERGGQVDGRRGLADAALLVAQRDDARRAVAVELRRASGSRDTDARWDRSRVSSAFGEACRLDVPVVALTSHRVSSTSRQCLLDSSDAASRHRAAPDARARAMPRSARARVRRRVHVAQRVDRDVRVDLGRRDRRVAEQLLHDAHVGAALQQVRRERVPQGVRRHVRGQLRPLGRVAGSRATRSAATAARRARRGTAAASRGRGARARAARASGRRRARRARTSRPARSAPSTLAPHPQRRRRATRSSTSSCTTSDTRAPVA